MSTSPRASSSLLYFSILGLTGQRQLITAFWKFQNKKLSLLWLPENVGQCLLVLWRDKGRSWEILSYFSYLNVKIVNNRKGIGKDKLQNLFPFIPFFTETWNKYLIGLFGLLATVCKIYPQIFSCNWPKKFNQKSWKHVFLHFENQDIYMNPVPVLKEEL